MLLRISEVKQELGVRSSSCIYDAIKRGTFPRPVRIGMRAVAWPDYEVKEICKARIANASDLAIQALVCKMYRKRSALLRDK